MHEGLLEASLNDVFRVLPDTCVSLHHRQDLLLITFEEGFKRLFVSALSGNYEDLLCGGIIWLWVHVVLSMSASEKVHQILSSAFCAARHGERATTAPNLRNRKSLNPQKKTAKSRKCRCRRS
jgi:hypothetical protein